MIYIKSYQTFLAFSYTAGLLMVRKEQILLQPPVQKCSDLRHLKHFKNSSLTYLQKGFSGSCDKAVLGIFVNKYFQGITLFGSLWNLFAGKKHSVLLSGIFIFCKVNTEFYGLCHNKLLFFSYFDHGFSL